MSRSDTRCALTRPSSLDPELRALVPSLLEHMRELGGPDLRGLEVARSKLVPPPPLQSPEWTERLIPGPAGRELRLFIVRPLSAGSKPRPALLHLHGGGFITGSAKGSLAALQGLVSALDCVAVSVEYRLAPETRFPGALEDNYTALEWLHVNAAELGVDPGRIALVGESAGGGHAAMLAIHARDRGQFPVAFQALIYPMLDDRTGSTRSVPNHIGTLLWTAELNAFGWSCLLGQPAGSPDTPAGAVPARVPDLRGLPPTFIAVGSLDLFVHEAIEYARRLIDHDVAVELQVVPGAIHAFDAVAPDAAVSQTFKASLTQVLARALRASH